jgi:hypothetical protein
MRQSVIGILTLAGCPLLLAQITSPTLTSIAITPGQVNVSSSDATVSVDVGITNNITGSNWGVISFLSPSGQHQLYAILIPISGTTTTGVFGATVNVAQGAEVGVWHIGNITLMDGASINASLSYAAVTAAGLQGVLTVTDQLSDTTPPPPGKIGVFRVAGALGLWVYDTNGNGVFDPSDKFSWFGLAGDYPVVGDWNGTGTQSIGVFRGGVWYLDLNNNGQWDGVEGGDGIYYFGLPGDIPVVGDWTGSGVSRFGVFRCSPGQVCAWILDVNGSKTYDPSDPIYYYGLYGDAPVVNNWSGAGKEDQIGVYRPMPNGLAMWIVDSNGSGAWDPSDAVYQFGLASDLPVVGNWNNGTRKRIGVFRNGTWILDTNGDNAYEVTDGVAFFGLPNDKPVVGNWLQ